MNKLGVILVLFVIAIIVISYQQGETKDVGSQPLIKADEEGLASDQIATVRNSSNSQLRPANEDSNPRAREIQASSVGKNPLTDIQARLKENRQPTPHPLLGPWGGYQPFPSNDQLERYHFVFSERHVWHQSQTPPKLPDSPVLDYQGKDNSKDSQNLSGIYMGVIRINEINSGFDIHLAMSFLFQRGSVDEGVTDVSIYDRKSGVWQRLIQRDPAETGRGLMVENVMLTNKGHRELHVFISLSIFPDEVKVKFAEFFNRHRKEGWTHLFELSLLFRLREDDDPSEKEIDGLVTFGAIHFPDGRRRWGFIEGQRVNLGSVSLKKIQYSAEKSH